MTEKAHKTPSMLRKLFSKKSRKSKSAVSPNSSGSSVSIDDTETWQSASSGEEEFEASAQNFAIEKHNPSLLCGSVNVVNSVEEVLLEDPITDKVTEKPEYIFEEPGDIEDQKNALSVTLLEQQQRHKVLSKKLSHDQKCIVMMQGELRATLLENKLLDKKILTIENEIKSICKEIQKEMEKDTNDTEKRLKQKFPDLYKKYSTCITKKHLLNFIRTTDELRQILTKAERLAKVKYFDFNDRETSNASTTDQPAPSPKPKKGFISRKKVIAKRYHSAARHREQTSLITASNDNAIEMMDMGNGQLALQNQELQNRINVLLNNVRENWETQV